jgi:hypothetical protein
MHPGESAAESHVRNIPHQTTSGKCTKNYEAHVFLKKHKILTITINSSTISQGINRRRRYSYFMWDSAVAHTKNFKLLHKKRYLTDS